MRVVTAFLACLLILTGCGHGAEKDPHVRTAGSLTAQFMPVPNPPTVGHDSGFSVTLTDAGQPVTGAQVNLALFYRSLNQTGPTATCLETSPGHYEANELSTGMNGSWEAEVTVTRANQPPNQQNVKLTFPFHVAK